MRRLQNTLDQAMGEALTRRDWSEMWGEGIAPVDLMETEDAVVLKSALPGVDEEDIDITVSDEHVTLRAEVQEGWEEKGARYHIREQRSKKLSRTVPLPTPVDADQAEATFGNGVLRLTMPKSESAKTKTIKLKTK
jgi:HSP20 family protein